MGRQGNKTRNTILSIDIALLLYKSENPSAANFTKCVHGQPRFEINTDLTRHGWVTHIVFQ